YCRKSCVDVRAVNTEFCRKRSGIAAREKSGGSVDRTFINVNELRYRLSRKCDLPFIEYDQLRSVVANSLTNLLCGISLFLFGFAADDDDRRGVANVVMRRKRRAQIREDRCKILSVGDREIIRLSFFRKA